MVSISSKAISLIKTHEELRLKPYLDTVNKLTIGYGHNLDDRAITEFQALDLLQGDLVEALKDAQSLFKNFDKLNEARQGVIINMSFNLGKSRLSKFKKFIAAVDKGDWPLAVKEMLDSLWARQLPNRSEELSNIMQRGEW